MQAGSEAVFCRQLKRKWLRSPSARGQLGAADVGVRKSDFGGAPDEGLFPSCKRHVWLGGVRGPKPTGLASLYDAGIVGTFFLTKEMLRSKKESVADRAAARRDREGTGTAPIDLTKLASR